MRPIIAFGPEFVLRERIERLNSLAASQRVEPGLSFGALKYFSIMHARQQVLGKYLQGLHHAFFVRCVFHPNYLRIIKRLCE